MIMMTVSYNYMTLRIITMSYDIFSCPGQIMSFSLWTTAPRFPKLPQTAGRKCLQTPLSFSSGSSSSSMTFLFFCEYFSSLLMSHRAIGSPVNVGFSTFSHQAQTDTPPVLPPAQKRPPGGQTVLPRGDCTVSGCSSLADRVWRLHA